MIQTPKALLPLGLVALGSIALNAVLLFQTGRLAHKAESAADAREAQVRAELSAADADMLRTQIGLSALVTGWLASDRTELLTDLQGIAERARAREIRWRDRAVPTPACGPGQEFVDGTNELIGGAL